jgi:hypothetical protein
VNFHNPLLHGGFQVKSKKSRQREIVRNRIRARKRRLDQRLDKSNFPDDLEQPMFRQGNMDYELAGRAVGTSYGGIGLIHQLALELGLPEAIDRHLHLFKFHMPYHESDHVLNLAYNALCGGTCLQDLELRRQDEAYLNIMGAGRIPDPTTAGDFCRRFKRHDLNNLQAAYDEARLKIWAQQPAEFFEEAIIEGDGSIVETGAECKQGVDISYKRLWGYHPLLLTLANTGEVLRLLNRSGNRPSHEGAAPLFDEAIDLCDKAGFRRVLVRGDTDFSQTKHLDRWHERGNVTFHFGFDCTPLLHILADDLPSSAWKKLARPPRWRVKTKRRRKPARVKQRLVEQHRFDDTTLIDEWVAEMPYRPVACKHTYRLIVVRKNLRVHKPRQGRLFNDYKYFIYITNDWERTPEQIVFSANDRCNQENHVAQLKDLRALHAPVDNLLSNEAYMLMTSLAWNLKAWLALRLPVTPCHREKHEAEKRTLLRMEFRTFVNSWLRIPCQVLRTGRQLVCRLLAYNDWQSAFFRLADQLCHPRRC